MGRRLALTALLVAALAVIAHARSLSGGFVYDDHRFVVQNPAIRGLGRTVEFFTDPSTASAAAGIEPDVYRPVRTLAYALDRTAFGTAPFGFHLGNVVLHAVCALLVWRLLVRVLRAGPSRAPPLSDRAARARVGAATAAAAVFAVHPVAVEAVAWISSRGDLLALAFLLLAIESATRPGLLRAVGGAALLLLACFSKESALVGPLLLPLVVAALPATERPALRTTLARTATWAVLVAGYLAWRAHVLPGAADRAPFAQTEFPEGGRAAAARAFLAAVAWYARVLVWPVGFPFDRNPHTAPAPSSFLDPQVVLGAGLLATALLAGARAVARRDGVLVLAILGPLVALLPVSQVIVPLKTDAAERFLYPALPFLLLLPATVLARWLERPRAPARAASLRRVSFAIAGTVVGVLLATTARRAQAWESDETLWTAAQREDPMNPRAYEGIGYQRLREGLFQKAERAYDTYIEFQPQDGKARAKVAEVYWGVYQDLFAVDPGRGEIPELAAKRRFVLENVLRRCDEALAIWRTVGLERGRGSEALLRRTLELEREAALEGGFLLHARRANAMLAGDDLRLHGRQVYAERRMLAILAATALTAARPQGGPATPGDADRERTRRVLLEDAKVDPNLSDPEAARALLPLFALLLDEHPDDAALRRNRVLLHVLSSSGATSPAAAGPDLREALKELEILLRTDPRDAWAAGLAEAVRARLGR